MPNPVRWLAVLVLAVGLALAPRASAAPVQVDYTLSISYGFESPWPPPQMGSGTVDVSGGTLTIPAGFIAVDSIVVPVSASTAIASPLVFEDLGNRTGVFQLGGVASQAPGQLCPASGTGFACNVGGGVGGTMTLTGSMSIPLIPDIFVITLDFASIGIGAGGSTNVPVGGIDAAAWTTATARVHRSDATESFFGTSGRGSLSLVTPVYAGFVDSFLTFRLTLSPVTLIPEPTSLLLLAIGSVGLAFVLRR